MNHAYYMQIAFDLANKGMGHTSPNPLVGAIIVKDNKILGTGYHQKYGGAHAEVNAILDAKSRGENIEGSTLYCNLEPCSHTKKQTPPCAPRIVQEKISHVVIANIDPNPQVSGGGVEILRSHGITVTTGVLESAGLILNEVFFKFIKTQTPFVHLKMAQTLDGRVATKHGESKYITGPESLSRVHQLRQKYDAIMVGSKTVALDNPGLTTRSEDFDIVSHPIRLVVGKLSSFNYTCKVFSDEFKSNTIVITTNEDVEQNLELARFLEKESISLLSVAQNKKGEVDLHEMLKALALRKITSILVEGGPTLATSFLKEHLVDKVSFFIAPTLLGEGRNSLNDLGISSLQEKMNLLNTKTEILGNDILVEGYLCSQV